MLQGTKHRYLISDKIPRDRTAQQDRDGECHETCGPDTLRIWWRAGPSSEDLNSKESEQGGSANDATK